MVSDFIGVAAPGERRCGRMIGITVSGFPMDEGTPLLIGIAEQLRGTQDGTTLRRAMRVGERLEDIAKTAGRASIMAATMPGDRLITVVSEGERGTGIRIRRARLRHRALTSRVPAPAGLRTSQLRGVWNHHGA
jgi:hypothetical protein